MSVNTYMLIGSYRVIFKYIFPYQLYPQNLYLCIFIVSKDSIDYSKYLR